MADSQIRPQLGGDTILLNSNPYRIATIDGALAYQEGNPAPIQEGSPGLPVAVGWVGGSPGGMGEARKMAQETQGYWYTDGMDASQYGCIRLAPRVIGVVPVNPITDYPTWPFEFGGYVYIPNGRYIYKCSASGSTLTLHREIDMGSGAVAGHYAIWGVSGYAARPFVPCGDSVKFWRLDTVGSEASVAFSPAVTLNESGLTAGDTTITVNDASGVSLLDVAIINSERWLVTAKAGNDLTVTRGYAGTTAVGTHTSGTAITKATGDTWTQDSALYALAFATTNQGGSLALVRGYSTNLIGQATSVSGSEPIFVGSSQVGTSDSAIPSMEDSGTRLFVAKQENLYEVDALPSGGINWRQVTAFPPGSKSANHGAGTLSPLGSAACYYNHGGLYLWDGDALEEVGPDAAGMNRNVLEQTIINLPIGGKHYSTAIAGRKYVYSAYRSPIGDRSWVKVGTRSEGRIKWDGFVSSALGYSTAKFCGLLVDSAPRLWIVAVSSLKGISFVVLSNNGGPDTGASSIGFGLAELDFKWISPLLDCGYPHTLKQWEVVEVYGEDLDAAAPLQVSYGTETAAGSITALGATITTDGLSLRYFSSVAAYLLSLQLAISTTVDYTSISSATDPRILSLIVRAYLRPTLARRVNFTIQTDGELGTGGGQQLSPAAILSNLVAMEGAAPQAYVDPNGNTANISVVSVNERIKSPNPLEYYIDVSAVTFVDS